MPGSTAKGVPFSLGTDAASTIDTTMQSLAGWVDERPGIATVTTVQRDALVGASLWMGRQVFNTTTLQPEVWNGISWVAAGGNGTGYTRIFLLMGA